MVISATHAGIEINSGNQHPLDLPMLQLAHELHKAILRKFKKRKVCSSYGSQCIAINK